MKKFNYSRSYIPMVHQDSKSKSFFGFNANPDELPSLDIDTFLQTDDYTRHLNEYGENGWELIGTESVTLPIYDIRKKTSYQITRGFILFWKKEIS